MPESFEGSGGEDLALAKARVAEAYDHLSREQIDDAVRAMLEAADYAPNDSRTLHAFVHQLQDRGRHREALIFIERILALEPDNANALIDLGFCCEPLGDTQRAYDAYTRASELDPHDAMALNNRAYLELSRGNLDAALRDVDAALARDDSEGIAHATRAEILATQGKIREAFVAITRAVEIDDEWLDTAKSSDHLAVLRAHDQWGPWLAEHDPNIAEA